MTSTSSLTPSPPVPVPHPARGRRASRSQTARWFARLYALLALGFVLCAGFTAHAQNAPSHDPSRMVQNVDGRYWVFTTGNGVWAMSSPTPDFTSWRAEPTVFQPGTWPSWINNYVTGFNGHFWAPDVVGPINGTYYLYYSCAGQGAPAAIGLATATNLAGPWTDRGMIVAGNNTIDPAVFIEGNSWWMAYGNWVSGIDLIQLNPANGQRMGSSRWLLQGGQVEGPRIMKNGGYYYLFFQRGLCCNGVNSGYHVQVARSTSITGPYTNERSFLPNRDGRFIGPGHVSVNFGRLIYHFYDGQNNGAARLRVTTMGWSGGWPVAHGTGAWDDGGNWTVTPPQAQVRRLQSHNFPTRFVRHRGFRAYTEANVSPAQDAQFRIVPGLAGAQGVSFESVNFPGHYLRMRSDGQVWVEQGSGSTFNQQATFRRVPGLADQNKSSYQSWSNPSIYLRHYGFEMFAQSGSGATFNADATFAEVQ